MPGGSGPSWLLWGGEGGEQWPVGSLTVATAPCARAILLHIRSLTASKLADPTAFDPSGELTEAEYPQAG